MKTDTTVIENREEAFSTELEDVFESSADEPSGDVAEQQKSEVIIDDVLHYLIWKSHCAKVRHG